MKERLVRRCMVMMAGFLVKLKYNQLTDVGFIKQSTVIAVNLDWSTVNWIKQPRYALIVQNNSTADDKGG